MAAFSMPRQLLLRFVIGLLTVSTALPSGTTEYAALTKFQEWLLSHGGALASSAAFASKQAQCTLDIRPSLGVVTTARLAKETVIVGVPHSLLLWPSDTSKCPSCDSYERLALRLLEEKAAGKRSLWAPYIEVLPSEVGNALDFERDELLELRGTYAGTVAIVARQRASRFLARSRRDLPGLFTDEALRWALSIVLSRSLAVGAPNAPTRNTSGSVRYDTPFLAPGADFLNHKHGAHVGWTFRAKADAPRRPNGIEPDIGSNASPMPDAGPEPLFGIVALSPLPRAGMEISNAYEELANNAHTLAYYGFVSPDNDADALVISLPLLPPALAARSGASDLLSVALGDARRDLNAHLDVEVGLGRASAALADAVKALLPAGHDGSDTTVVPNVTIVLHRPARGPPPSLLLNAARLAALSLPATQEWLDGHAKVYGPKGVQRRESVHNASAAPDSKGRVPPKSQDVVWYDVVVPASGEEEVNSVTSSLRASALSRVSAAAGQLLGAVPGAPHPSLLVPHNKPPRLSDGDGGSGRTEAYAVDPATGRVIDLSTIGRHLQLGTSLHPDGAALTAPAHALSAAFNAPVLLSSPLNASLLLDLLAHRVLLSSLRRLMAGYPANLRADEATSSAIAQRIDAILVECGILHESGTATARVPGARTESAAQMAASAFSSLGSGSGRRALTFAELSDRDSELRGLRVQLSILHARVGELRILQDVISRLETGAVDVAEKLRKHKVEPLIAAPASSDGSGVDGQQLSAREIRRLGLGRSWEADWAQDLPDIDGYFSSPSSMGAGMWYQGGHVHEEDAEDCREAETETERDALEADSWGEGTQRVEQGPADEVERLARNGRPHARLRHGSHAEQHEGIDVDVADEHVSRHTEHVHSDGSNDVASTRAEGGEGDEYLTGREPYLLPRSTDSAPTPTNSDAMPADERTEAREQSWTPVLRQAKPLARTEPKRPSA